MKTKLILTLWTFVLCLPGLSARVTGDHSNPEVDPLISEWSDDGSGAYIKLYRDRETSEYRALVFTEKFANADPVCTLKCSPAGKKAYKLDSQDGWSGTIRGNVLELQDADGTMHIRARRMERIPINLGRKAPEGAVVLFDGTSLDNWLKLEPKKWTEGSGPASESAVILPDGAMRLIPREKKNGSIISKWTFSNFLLHVEFRVPLESQVNGGVYLLSKYEINIKDTFGQGKGASCCSFGNVSAPVIPQPSHNYSLPPMVWQTLEVEFNAPAFDAAGNKISNARATVWFNGELIYEDVQIEALKGAVARSPERSAGPIYLQEHGVSYDFRNIWIVDKTR